MNILDNLAARIDLCGDEIDKRNRDNLVLFSKGALLLAVIIMVASLVLPYYHWLLLPHGYLSVYTGILYFIARYCQKNKVPHIRALQYLVYAPLLYGGILVGTVYDPTRPAVTILIFLCVIPLFMLDKPWRMLLYQLFFTLMFVGYAYKYKSAEIFAADMLYLPIYLAYLMSANLYTLMDKVSSAENYLLVCRDAEQDVLTDLFNRKTGEARMAALLTNKVPGTFAILDIDDFKNFNDEYGHQAGDTVLRQVSLAMHAAFRSSDVLWRLGGDEFAIYAVNLLDADLCRKRFQVLMDKLRDIALTQEISTPVNVSVGCTICDGADVTFKEIYKLSDEALYEAKKLGKGRMIVREAEPKTN